MILFDRLDAIPPLSPEELLLLDSVKALARDGIAPRAAEYNRSGAFPWNNIRAINALGLKAMFGPEAYGGRAVLCGVSRLRARDQRRLRLDRQWWAHRHCRDDRLA